MYAGIFVRSFVFVHLTVSKRGEVWERNLTTVPPGSLPVTALDVRLFLYRLRIPISDKDDGVIFVVKRGFRPDFDCKLRFTLESNWTGPSIRM